MIKYNKGDHHDNINKDNSILDLITTLLKINKEKLISNTYATQS